MFKGISKLKFRYGAKSMPLYAPGKWDLGKAYYSKALIVRPSIIRHPHSTAESCQSQNFTT